MNYFQKRLKQIEAAKEERQGQGAQGALGSGVSGGGFNEGEGKSFAAQRGAQGQMGQSFGQQTKAFSRTQQADDPNRQAMREDYGWKMTGRQYEAIEKDRGKFESNLRDYRQKYDQRIGAAREKGKGEIAAEEAKYQGFKKAFAGEYAKNKSTFESARKKLGSMPSKDSLFNQFWDKTKMRVTVWDGQNEQGTYWVPRPMVNNLHKNVEGSYTGKGTYRVNVRQQGRTRGQEMHDLLRKDLSKSNVKQEVFKDPSKAGEFQKGINDWRRAESDLNKAQSAWNKTVATDRNALHTYNSNIQRSKLHLDQQLKSAGIDRDKDIRSATVTRQAQIDAAREAYQKRASARRQAYANLAGMTGSAKAKGTQGQQNTEGQQ